MQLEYFKQTNKKLILNQKKTNQNKNSFQVHTLSTQPQAEFTSSKVLEN